MARNIGIGILLNPAGFRRGVQSVKRGLTEIRREGQNMARGVSRGFNGLRQQIGLVAADTNRLPRAFQLTGQQANAAIGGLTVGAFAAASSRISAFEDQVMLLPGTFNQSSRGVIRSLGGIGDAVDILDAEFRVLPNTVGLLSDKTRTASRGMSGMFGRITTAAGLFGTRLSGLIPTFSTLRRVGNRNLGSLDAAFRGIGRAVFNLRNAIIGLGAAMAARSIVNAGLRFDKIRLTMEAISDSAEQAADEMNFVGRVADTLGLDLEVTARSYAKLTASALGSELAGQNVRAIFLAVAKAATALSLSTEETEGAFRAIQQTISKGNVQAEELRGQLGERLPGAFNLAAEAMGVTTSELNKMLEQGEVLASDLLPRLAVVLEDRFGKGAENASNSVRASFNRLSTSFFRLQATIARSGVNDALSEIADTLAALFNDMVRDGRAEAFGRTIAGAIITIGNAASATGRILSGLHQGLDEFFAKMANTWAADQFGVSVDRLDEMLERERMGALAGQQGAPDTVPLEVEPIIKTGSAGTGQDVIDQFNEILALTERQIRLNRELADVARDGASAQDALIAAFEAEQEVKKLGFVTDAEKRDAINQLTEANIRLLQSERDLRAEEERIEQQRQRAIDTAETIADLRFERDGLIKLNEAREESIQAYRREQAAQEANLIIRRLGIDTASEQADEIRGLVQEIEHLRDKYPELEEPFNAVEKAFLSGVDNMENALVDFATTARIEFNSLANAILRDINRIFIQDLFSNPLKAAITGEGDAGIFSGISNLFGNSSAPSLGSDFIGPMPAAANGGVFTSPFVGGEAGPEAAVPLPDGRRIPVEMQGGGNVTVQMVVNVPEGRQMMDSERQMLREAGNQIARQVNRARN